jgi:hypothetical protein
MVKIDNSIRYYSNLRKKDLKKVEKDYNAKFVGEMPVRDSLGNWTPMPCLVFYTEEAHPQGSNWFGLYENPMNGNLYICDAKSATEEPFSGLLVDDLAIYSHWRHDYHVHPKGESAAIDGGFDYVKHTMGEGQIVKLQVNKDKIELVVD